VWLPACRFHDLGQHRALRALAITSAFLLVRSAFGLAARRPALGFGVAGAGLPLFSLSIAFSLIEFSFDRVAVVTFITPLGRNSKQNL
jgi:hypothetical protein